MTIEPPNFTHRRPTGPRDPGDAWVVADTGERYWGRFGAAGLLAHDPARGILLQHRVSWSHFGGTWGIPGGARHQHEDAVAAALRESEEEAGSPPAALRVRATSVLDLDIWTYTTVIARVAEPFEPVIADPESVELAWVPVDDVDARALHPGFGEAWPLLRGMLERHPHVIVDAANVVGSRPDGWWRDRAGAARGLVDEVARWRAAGVDAAALGESGTSWFPAVTLVVEGQARGVVAADGVEVIAAAGSGDDAIVDAVAAAVAGRASASDIRVVTSDRALRGRVEALGATTHGAGWLRDQLG